MSASVLHHALSCAAQRRHKRRRPRRASTSALLHAASPDVAARLLSEGVPEDEVREVASQLKCLLPVVTTTGCDVAYIRLHPWVHELIQRYGDKIGTILMTTRGKVDAR